MSFIFIGAIKKRIRNTNQELNLKVDTLNDKVTKLESSFKDDFKTNRDPRPNRVAPDLSWIDLTFSGVAGDFDSRS